MNFKKNKIDNLNKMFFAVLFIFTIFILNLNIISCSEINDDFKVTIKYPIIIDLDNDYDVYPNLINIRDQDDFDIYAGQTIISKYDFNNKLNYNLNIVFDLNKSSEFINDNSDILEVYLLKDVLSKTDCTNNSGEVYKFNNEEIYIEKDNTKKYLCYYEDLDSLKVDLELEPGINSVYLLFVSKPNLKTSSSRELNFNTFLEINTDNIDFNTDLSNMNDNYDNNDADLLRTLNNGIDKLNSNFDSNSNDGNNSSLFDVNKAQQTFSNIKDGAEDLKSGATGLVTLNVSSLSVIIGGLILVILLALFITNKSKKKDNEFKDLDSL